MVANRGKYMWGKRKSKRMRKNTIEEEICLYDSRCILMISNHFPDDGLGMLS